VVGSAEWIESKDGTSHYALSFPYDNLPLSNLILETEAPFFDRHYELLQRDERFAEPDRLLTLSQGRLWRRAGKASVSLSFPVARASKLELLVQDGDDAPLVFTEVTAAVPVAELFFPAPAGGYRLLLGSADVPEPQYELERIRELVLAVASAPSRAGALTENPDFRMHAGSGGRRLFFWLAILLAVIVLAFLTLRLARAPQES
jgi:hypothetical protein